MDGSYAPLSEEEVPGAVPQPLKHTPVGQGQATAAVRGVPPVHQVNSEQQQQQQQQAEPEVPVVSHANRPAKLCICC